MAHLSAICTSCPEGHHVVPEQMSSNAGSITERAGSLIVRADARHILLTFA